MRVCDYLIPLCATVKAFDGSAGIAPDALAANIDTLIQQAQNQALGNGVSLDTFQQALFPVLAWADEHISRQHRWTPEHAWQKHLLQRRYFKTGLAGREFFERLQTLDSADITVREVYLLCLCLGFLGRFSVTPNSAELASIRMEQYALLQKADPSFALAQETALFPHAYAMAGDAAATRPGRGKPAHARRFTWRKVMLFLLPPLILILVAAGLHAELTFAVQHFRQAVNL